MEKEYSLFRNPRLWKVLISIISVILLAEICIGVKVLVHENLVLGQDYVIIPNILTLHYAKHFCDYLVFENGMTAAARLINMSFLICVFIFNDEREYGIASFITHLVLLIISNLVCEPNIKITFEFFIVMMCYGLVFYVSEIGKRLLESKLVMVMLLIYAAGILGNIIDQNMFGYVTDYIRLFPNTNTWCSNIEDWLNWIPKYGIGVYAVGCIAVDLIKDFIRAKEEERGIW